MSTEGDVTVTRGGVGNVCPWFLSSLVFCSLNQDTFTPVGEPICEPRVSVYKELPVSRASASSTPIQGRTGVITSSNAETAKEYFSGVIERGDSKGSNITFPIPPISVTS